MSSNIEYDSCAVYVQSAKSLKDKYKKICALIDMLYNTALKAADTDNIKEYWLDDGLTKIKTVYNGTEGVLKAIDVLERQKQTVLNQLNGRVTRSVDSGNFIRR